MVEVATALLARIRNDEEASFGKTLARGLQEFEKKSAQGALTGETIFTLQSTFGMPFELVAQLAHERGQMIARDAYEDAMQAHRERSRGALVRETNN